MTVLLETRNVSKSYGEFRALDQVTMAVREGELVSVVGPNGAGKTTLVNLLPRFVDPNAGSIRLDGVPLQDWSMTALRRQFEIGRAHV